MRPLSAAIDVRRKVLKFHLYFGTEKSVDLISSDKDRDLQSNVRDVHVILLTI